MTVAAIIVAPAPEAALRLVDGEPAIRRVARAAWAGGAIPILVAAPDPDGRIAAALEGTEAQIAPPSMPAIDPARWHDRVADEILAAAQAAAAGVIGTTAVLVWPVKRSWVGPETVTSLIEAHGADRGRVIRPTFHGEAGLPTLVPIGSLEDVLAGRTAEPVTAGSGGLPRVDLGAQPRRCVATLLGEAADNLPSRMLELGDPGTVVSGNVPREQLPAYEGPLREELPDAGLQDAPAFGSGSATDAGEGADGDDDRVLADANLNPEE